jgi:DNA polymerase-3 subunit delta
MIFKEAQIKQYINKADKNIRCFLIYGPNRGLVDEWTNKIAKSKISDLNDAFRVANIANSSLSQTPNLLEDEYNAISLMGGDRVIIINEADNNITKKIKTLLENPNPDCLIIINSYSMNKSSSMVKLADKENNIASVACYEDRAEDIYNFAKSTFAEHGFMIKADALQLLCSHLSNDRKASANEIEKLIIYMDKNKNISVEDIKAVIGDNAAINNDDLSYFCASGNIANAIKTLDKLILEGTEPVAIIRILYYHFYKLISANSHLQEGKSLDEAINKLVPRIIFYRKSSFKNQLAFWPKDKLYHVLSLLYNAEKDCKTTNMPTKEICSRLIMQITSAASKLHRR